MFYVKSWDTDEILSEHQTLPIARRYCRGEGHTGEIAPNGYYFPIAYIADEDGYVVYNPRFSTTISPAVGGLVNTFDNHLRG